MEMEKRKRSHNGEADGRRTRAKEGTGGDLTMADQAETETTGTATEEEVEEFFAILRRVHEVIRYFGKGKSGGGDEGEVKRGSGKGWNPSFHWEDFEDVQVKQYDGVVNDKKDSKIKGRGGEKRDVEAVEENLFLDLNAEPESLSDMN